MVESPRRLITCPSLAAFDMRDREAARTAFTGSPMLALGQAWRGEPEETFRPGKVRVGWRDDRFWVHAELTGDAIFNASAADNGRLWELGDVFEIFLGDSESAQYVEFHIAPNGKRVQLLWPDARPPPSPRPRQLSNRFR
jgi:hypothetical protein